jgi:hypothetical protein
MKAAEASAGSGKLSCLPTLVAWMMPPPFVSGLVERIPHCLLDEIAMTIGWSLRASSNEPTLVGVRTGSIPIVGS